ncbi:MAG TPA: DoxX family membrane protein, partial [Ferruginibacter sp.]|nr:DoxX family membrane protein [Ferruginibacter sp.]
MKIIVNIARVLVGCLFIFSGLVKAIDPLGLAYKMQEFFEVWAASGYLKGMMDLLYDQALLFSVLMIALEVLLGVALLLGWRLKPVSWFLLALTLFFTFLTSYVLFSGKIRACGCFGDCIPLTPVQTFTKDLVLLLLVLIILLFGRYVTPLFPPKVNGWLVMGSLLAVAGLQWYVLRHLPVVDCLPFRSGNNILELRKMPKDAVPDKYDYVFVYSKNGEKKEFRVNALPDSTWVFVERKQTLVQKGKNNIPLINDFILKTQDGTDTTEAILNTPGTYYLLFIKDFPGAK